MPMSKPRLGRVLAALLLASAPASALAWGATGHRLIGVLAMQALPATLPGFLRTPDAATEVGELARELDRSKGGGKVHDEMRDPGHFVDVDDAGLVLGGPALTDLPTTKAQYDKALVAAGVDSVKTGWLPYAIVDDYQQLVRDFAIWRVVSAGERLATTAERRAWYREDRLRRERQILSDLGPLAHHVGDGSQPHHVSVHYNGWGDYPNPNGYTKERVHGPFEGAFVRATADLAAVRAAMPEPRVIDPAKPEAAAVRYIGDTLRQVEPFYRLEKQGGFKLIYGKGDPRGADFAKQRLAAGAAELRDLITAAWTASATAGVGYPAVPVPDYESGKVDPWNALYGND